MARLDRNGHVIPVDDVGPYGGLSVALSAYPSWMRPTCPAHEGQPLAWRVHEWACPREDCDRTEEGRP